MDEIEDEAKAAAEKMVMNMMQRPGQLEKVRRGYHLITSINSNTFSYSTCFKA